MNASDKINLTINLLDYPTILFLIGGLVFYKLIKYFFPSYFSKKAENLATKEDISKITEKIESVKTNHATILEEVKNNHQLNFAEIARKQSIKREVFLDAVEAIAKYQKAIENFSNLEMTDLDISTRISECAGKIAKVMVVGSNKTIRALTTYISFYEKVSLELMSARIGLTRRRDLIQLLRDQIQNNQNTNNKYLNLMEEYNIEGKTDEVKWKTINFLLESNQKNISNDVSEAEELESIQSKESIEYCQLCMIKYSEVNSFILDIIISIREELELELSKEELKECFDSRISKSSENLHNFFSKMENLVKN